MAGKAKALTFKFLRTAQGSLKELETHCVIAQRVGIMDEDVAAGLLAQSENVGKLLRLLIRKLEDTA